MGREGLIRRTCELLRELRPNELTRAELARRAGVDPGLIRYYFRDRATLLEAAGAALVNELVERTLQATQAAGDDPAAQLRARIQSFLRFVQVNPFFPRLMEEFMHSSTPSAQEAHSSWTAPAVALVRDLMARGEAAGEFRPVDGAFIFMAMLGASEFFINAGPIQRIAFGAEVDGEALITRYEEFLTTLVERGLRP